MLPEIGNKNIIIEDIAKKVVNDLFEYVKSDKAVVKYNSLKVLIFLSEHQPNVLYKEWDFFVKLLDNDNTFLRAIGLRILANLTKIDKENYFEKIFEKYYSLLDDKSMINAANIAGHSGIIAQAKPHLQEKITDKLLTIDKTHHSSECKNIIKGKAILSFNQYIDEYEDKEKIIRFVKKELNKTRSATRKKAEKILKKWDI